MGRIWSVLRLGRIGCKQEVSFHRRLLAKVQKIYLGIDQKL